MTVLDKPDGRNITRYQAADIARFTEAVEHGFIHDPDGDIQYAVTVMIDGNYYGAQFTVAGESKWSENRLAEGIMRLYAELVADGVIGHAPLRKVEAVTLTGRPLDDLVQVGLELTAPPTADESAALAEIEARAKELVKH